MTIPLLPEEGEFFVDEAEKPIPPRNQWDELTTNQLIDLQLQLENNLWAFGKNKVIARTIESGLIELRALIAGRSS